MEGLEKVVPQVRRAAKISLLTVLAIIILLAVIIINVIYLAK
jgi:hypothetical protein